MKNIFYILLLLPTIIFAQYPSNSGQKITLGEQTTADGLVWRGVENDTALITPFSDTSAYIILDTINNKFYNYNRSTNVWSLAGGGGGGGGGVTSFSAGSTGLTPSTDTTGAVTLGGTLAVANGGTGASVKIFVDTFSNQIVNGLKTYSNIATFNDSIKVQSIRIGLGNNNISSNFSIGSNNLIRNTSGDQNTAVGHNVLRDNTTGGRNAGFGTNALRNNISGNSNMAIGVGSLQNCTDCIGNVAIGRESLELTTTNANDNVAIGYSALYNNTTGDRNVAIGSSAGIGIYPDTKANTTGINNIYIGYQSVGSSSGNTNEIIIGGNAIGNGSNSVTIGNSSITKTILNGNVGIGTTSPTEKLHVSGNGLFTGSMSLGTPLSVANGGTGSATQNFVDLNTNQTVNGIKTFKDSLFLGNVVVGKTRGNNTSIKFGINSGLGTADRNVAIGFNTLQVNTGDAGGLGENVAIGYNAGKNLTTGVRNMLLGYTTGQNMTSAGSNVAFGASALLNMVTGDENVAVGRAAMEQGTTLSGNTAVGQSTLFRTTGNFNTGIGYRAGWANSTNNNTTGTNNTFIGNEAVGASATASNVITLGNSSITTIRAQVTTITSLSDMRDKTDILPLNYGMNFIDKLKPVSFVWDMRDGGKIGIPEIGFIAQDLQKAQIDTGINIPNLVSGVEEKLEASYGVLLPIIVKALQEANEKIKSLEQRIINLENK